MNSMIYMVLRLNISVLHRDCDQLYHEQYDLHLLRLNINVSHKDCDHVFNENCDEHGVKIEHKCFT